MDHSRAFMSFVDDDRIKSAIKILGLSMVSKE